MATLSWAEAGLLFFWNWFLFLGKEGSSFDVVCLPKLKHQQQAGNCCISTCSAFFFQMWDCITTTRIQLLTECEREIKREREGGARFTTTRIQLSVSLSEATCTWEEEYATV
jgi:hypothetical protein